MRIGITGHRDLTPRTVELLCSEFARLLTQKPGLTTCISCLAEGADQLFAQAVLTHGGQLDAIVPSLGYGDPMSPDGHREYDNRIPSSGDAGTSLRTPANLEREDFCWWKITIFITRVRRAVELTRTDLRLSR